MYRAGKLVARGNPSKTFQPFLLPKGVNGSSKDLQDQLYMNFDPLMCYVKDLEASKQISGFIFIIPDHC